MRVIDISSISGLTDPYLIQVCDVYGSNCVFLSQIFTTVPPTVTVYLPSQFDSSSSVMVKVTTLDGCEKSEILDCISLYTPTPTPTPTNISSEICFTLLSEAIPEWSCVTYKSGFFNGKFYYEILFDDCLTIIGYVWWNNTSNQWEFTDVLGDNTGDFIAYNQNPGNLPITDGTYSWVEVIPYFVINSSVSGVCPTPTPTPTITTTPSITPTITNTPSITPTNTKTPTPTPFVWGSIGNILYSGTTSGDTCLFVPTDPLSYTGPVYLQFGSGTCCITSFSDDITSIGRHWYISISPFIDFPNGWYKLNCPSFPLYNNRLVQITSGLVTQQLYC